jgi:5-methylcytosine-specific restriction enzyme subunit McrC
MTSAIGDSETIVLEEYDQSKPLQLSESVLETIDNRINESTTRLDYAYTEEGKVRLRTSSYVGLVSLPNGMQVRIRPKAAGGNFLRLLLYAHGTTVTTLDSTVEALQGNLFLDAIGALFLERLQHVVKRGLDKDYLTKQARERYLRGRLDVHRQLSRGPVTATEFEVEYEDLTHDTIENQTVLYATHLLTRLVTERAVQSELRQREQQFRREVTLRPIESSELDTIQLDRLNTYYEDVLRLAKVIIESAFVDNLQAGTQESYGLLLNMNQIFEQVVERAAQDALSDSPWRVEDKAQIDGLVTGGTPRVRMYPDFVVRDECDDIQLVGDAKWKTGQPSQSDIYQMTSYQLADNVPGILLYPSQNDSVETAYQIDDRLTLNLRELPTGQDVTDFESFCRGLSDALQNEFDILTSIPR